MTKPLGIILAGGLATRMGGGDKGLLQLGDQPLLSHVIERLRPQVSGVALNANGDLGRFTDFDLTVVADSIEGFAGPLAGVLAGLDYAAEQGADHIVTAAADTPFFPTDLVEVLQLAAKMDDTDIALAATPDPERGTLRQPTFGLWPVALRDDLRVALNDGVRKVVQWTSRHNAADAMFPNWDYDPFFNINRPEDLQKAEAMLAEHS
ncbi:molybdenum cofactor guanylyltransferase MobA [Parasedimentitalea maritima]|uniref:Molybdenum cofactor guanylyltransferase n=1 Tax=Parasedimentitalea maritima TaxID=2578117 RepID=A0ABY2V192_9RHOB|nr:molybdenum cofactor guanylyltransferase MobA [Zongyanglinia marina]TLP69152.1 molybdenum cofactor guanylyltransferase MobA [Zongyanglinia marina]